MDTFVQDLTSQTLQNPFNHVSAYPINENVNPGLGQVVSLHHIFIPSFGKPSSSIDKKIEDVENQSGSGIEETPETKSEVDPKIKDAFEHPYPKVIETERHIFPKSEKRVKKEDLSGTGESAAKKPKLSVTKKIKHSFQIV